MQTKKVCIKQQSNAHKLKSANERAPEVMARRRNANELQLQTRKRVLLVKTDRLATDV